MCRNSSAAHGTPPWGSQCPWSQQHLQFPELQTPGASEPCGTRLGRNRAQSPGIEAGRGWSQTGFVQDISRALPATEQIPAPRAGSRSGLTFQQPGERDPKEMRCTQTFSLLSPVCLHVLSPVPATPGHPVTTSQPHCPGPVQGQSSLILTFLHS